MKPSIRFSVLFAVMAVGATFFLVTGCGHKKVKVNQEAASASTEKNMDSGVIGKIIWVKSKKKAVDFEMNLENKYTFPINFNNSSFKFAVNGMPASFNFQKFSGTIAPGGSETALVSFNFPEKKVMGPGALTIDGFYSEMAKRKISPLLIKFDVPAP